MNIKDEHTSRLWTFIMKGEIMAFELDESELIATRINNKAANWKEVEEYIEKNYVKKDKIKEKIEELNKKINDLRQMEDSCAKSISIEDCQDKIYLYNELLQEGYNK